MNANTLKSFESLSSFCKKLKIYLFKIAFLILNPRHVPLSSWSLGGRRHSDFIFALRSNFILIHVRSYFVEICNQIYFWKAQTFLKPKPMFPFERKTFWSANLDFKIDPLKISGFDNISQTKQYSNAITRDMPTIVWVR